MYVLALDESGTHNGAPVLLIAGLAVHEGDIRLLEGLLHAVLNKHLRPLSLDPWKHELHAKELKTPSAAKPVRPPYPATRDSEWLTVPGPVRLAVLADAYAAICGYEPVDPMFPVRIFGAVVERSHKQFPTAEKYAYDHVLHRFDEMLLRMNKLSTTKQRGVVLHDRRNDLERGIQDMAARWQRSGARLDALIQVPVFTDSRASRLIQAADFVTYALWRQYSRTPPDEAYSKVMWSLVDIGLRGELSGVIHLTPNFGRCACPPCQSRSSPKA